MGGVLSNIAIIAIITISVYIYLYPPEFIQNLINLLKNTGSVIDDIDKGIIDPSKGKEECIKLLSDKGIDIDEWNVFYDVSKGCWACPPNSERTLDAVNSQTACAYNCDLQGYKKDLTAGKCYKCPDNTSRTLDSVTSDTACSGGFLGIGNVKGPSFTFDFLSKAVEISNNPSKDIFTNASYPWKGDFVEDLEKNQLNTFKQKGFYKTENDECSSSSECLGFENAKPGTLACCKGKCTYLRPDWAGIGYCPDDCVGSIGGSKGTCAKCPKGLSGKDCIDKLKLNYKCPTGTTQTPLKSLTDDDACTVKCNDYYNSNNNYKNKVEYDSLTKSCYVCPNYTTRNANLLTTNKKNACTVNECSKYFNDKTDKCNKAPYDGYDWQFDSASSICYKCPTGFKRTLNSVKSDKACYKGGLLGLGGETAKACYHDATVPSIMKDAFITAVLKEDYKSLKNSW